MICLQNIYYANYIDNRWEKKDIFVKGDRIFFNLSVDDTKRTYNLNGLFCIPSFIDAHSHIGICRGGEPKTKKALLEKKAFCTSSKISNKISFNDLYFRNAYNSGVHIVSIDPGSTSFISGKCISSKIINGKYQIISKNTSLKIALGEVPFHFQKKKFSLHNPGDIHQILEEFIKSRPDIFTGASIKCHAYTKEDITFLIKLKKKYSLNLCILHGNEVNKLLPGEVNEINFIILGPIFFCSLNKEGVSSQLDTARFLYANNIKFALTCDHPVTPIQFLRLNSLLLRTTGIDDFFALKTITKFPAEFLGLEDYGIIEDGKKADFLIYDKNPLELDAKIIMRFVDGEMIYGKS